MYLSRFHLTISLLVVFIFSAGVSWVAYSNIETFRSRHQNLMEAQVNSAAIAIDQFVSDRLRIIGAFARDHEALIGQLYNDPRNETVEKQINDKLKDLFPTFFTFTLTDSDGHDLIDNIDDFVGPVCIRSIEQFASQFEQAGNASDVQHVQHNTEIHPQPFNYHFDKMSPWFQDGHFKGIFFVSFYPDVIQQRLRSYESKGHTLFVVHREQANLIEVSSSGARDKIGAHRDIRLTRWEVENILASRDVPHTKWAVVGIPKPGLFENFADGKVKTAGVLILILMLGTGMALASLNRSERARHRAMHEIQTTNEVLNTKLTELEIEKQRVEVLSITDRLTGLFNRLKLDNAFDTELSRVNRYGNQLAVIIFDLDHFKSVNDTYGHQVGDDVLIAVAGILKQCVRTVDIPGRWGGEEFLGICPETDSEGAGVLAEKIRQSIEAFEFPTVGKKTASFGVAALRDGDEVSSLTQRADEALYRAKEAGRNRVEFG